MFKRYFFSILTVIGLAPAISLSVFWFSAFDLSWYQAKQADIGVNQGLGNERVRQETENVFSFLAGQNFLNDKFYSAREQQHLLDIKKLITICKFITVSDFIILILVLALYWRQAGKLKSFENIFMASLASLLILFTSAVLILFFFDRVFMLFHQVLFSNDFWQLDPATEKLIVIFPPELFAALGLKIILISILASFLITLASGIYLWRIRNS